MRESCRLAVIEKPGGPVAVRHADLPELETGSVLLRTRFSEVCGTDCHLLHGKLSGVPYPLTPGHVSVGEIVEVRGDVRDLDGDPFRPGDMVTFHDVHGTCGRCRHCLVAESATLCPHRRVYGITYGTGDGLLGGWSQYLHLLPGVHLMRLPEAMSARQFIAGGCAVPTAFHAVERAGIRPGDTVVVQGSGPVGLATGLFARASGAGRVMMIGAPALRLDFARSLGVDDTLDLDALSLAERRERVRAATGGLGSDVTIEACGNPVAVPEGLQLTRRGGRYVIVGQYTDNGAVSINPHLDINHRHLDVRGCWGNTYRHLYLGNRLLSERMDLDRWSQAITRVYSLEEAAVALEEVARLEVIKAVIDPWKTPASGDSSFSCPPRSSAVG